MNDQTELSTLQRKAGVGRAPVEGAGMTPVKAFRLAISKAAQDELNLAARVVSAGEELANLPHLLEGLEPETLLMVLEGPQGNRGLAVFDPQVLAAVIEVQTTGHVRKANATPRPSTRTDSAMCETVLNRVLQEFEGHLAGEKASSWAAGYRFGEQIIGTRLLGLALADVEYRVFRLSLDLAEGAKTGELMLAFPAAGSKSAGPVADSARAWEQALEKTVCASYVKITAVLHRVEVPLDVVRNYKSGDLIPVPKTAVSKVLLEGVDGRNVGRARLGKQDGFRALRLSQSDVAPPSALERLPDTTTEIPMSPMPAMPKTDEENGMPDDPARTVPMTTGGAAPLMGTDQGAAELPDISIQPMQPMQDLPMDDVVVSPIAAMPMDLEIS